MSTLIVRQENHIDHLTENWSVVDVKTGKVVSANHKSMMSALFAMRKMGINH